MVKLYYLSLLCGRALTYKFNFNKTLFRNIIIRKFNNSNVSISGADNKRIREHA